MKANNNSCNTGARHACTSTHTGTFSASNDGQTLNGTVFERTSVRSASFKNAVLVNVSFHHSEAKKTNFSGATMDKITYALLKAMKADLENVVIK